MIVQILFYTPNGAPPPEDTPYTSDNLTPRAPSFACCSERRCAADCFSLGRPDVSIPFFSTCMHPLSGPLLTGRLLLPAAAGTSANSWRAPMRSSTCARASLCCAGTWRSRWGRDPRLGTLFAAGLLQAVSLALWTACLPEEGLRLARCSPPHPRRTHACMHTHMHAHARTARRLFSAADAPRGRLRRAADGRRRAKLREL